MSRRRRLAPAEEGSDPPLPARPEPLPLPQAIGNAAFTRLLARRGNSAGRGPQHGRNMGGVGESTVSPGQRGYFVARLNELLRIAGYDVSDGDVYDERTVEAVMAFQRREGIAAYGVVEDATWRALHRAAAAASAPPPRRPYPGRVKG